MNMQIGDYGKIVCAALLHDNCIYMGRKGHHEIFPMESIGVLRCAEQGFVTENGYFVNRELGLSIATHYNQINKKYHPLDKLVSEDLKKNKYQVKQRQEFKYKEKQKGILMKSYSKDKIIQEIISILKFYNDEKDNLIYANFLLNKINNAETITITAEEITKHLFKKETGEINPVVFNSLKRIEADMSNVDFSYKKIEGLNFNGLLNVEIDIEKIPNKNLKNVVLTGVELTGTLDNAYIENTDFTGYIGALTLNPQQVINNTIKGSKLSNIFISGSLDNIDITSVDFKNVKGDVKINPQKIPNKEMMGINFCDVEFCDENGNNNPSFSGCVIYDCKFTGIKNQITIDLDTLKSSTFPKLAICDLTRVIVKGNAKSNYRPIHCVKKDGTVLFDTVGDDLFGSYYYDDEGRYVHIYLYESMVWDNKTNSWKYIPRKEEKNLKIKVTFNGTQEKIKQKVKSKFKK